MQFKITQLCREENNNRNWFIHENRKIIITIIVWQLLKIRSFHFKGMIFRSIEQYFRLCNRIMFQCQSTKNLLISIIYQRKRSNQRKRRKKAIFFDILTDKRKYFRSNLTCIEAIFWHFMKFLYIQFQYLYWFIDIHIMNLI